MTKKLQDDEIILRIISKLANKTTVPRENSVIELCKWPMGRFFILLAL